MREKALCVDSCMTERAVIFDELMHFIMILKMYEESYLDLLHVLE